MSGQQTTENQSIVNRENAAPAVDLRDYFAAAALQPLVTSAIELDHSKWDAAVEHAYLIADAMLKAREVYLIADAMLKARGAKP